MDPRSRHRRFAGLAPGLLRRLRLDIGRQTFVLVAPARLGGRRLEGLALGFRKRFPLKNEGRLERFDKLGARSGGSFGGELQNRCTHKHKSGGGGWWGGQTVQKACRLTASEMPF
jgi:hypothetical protein